MNGTVGVGCANDSSSSGRVRGAWFDCGIDDWMDGSSAMSHATSRHGYRFVLVRAGWRCQECRSIVAYEDMASHAMEHPVRPLAGQTVLPGFGVLEVTL